MNKDKLTPASFILFSFVFALCALLLCALGQMLEKKGEDYTSVLEYDESQSYKRVIVLDAGHGGEDGGAVGHGGVLEKDINLKVAKIIYELLKLNDTNVIMTRTEDKMLYDRYQNYEGRKKMYDLRARVEMANEIEDSVLISIHMNSYPSPSCRGAQVYYSKNHSESYNIAGKVQTYLSSYVQKDNTRKIKAAGSNIYLLDKASSPAVLIECGFLSNPDDTKMLSDAEYRKKLACSIFAALCDYLG